eukprot:m.194081 g.194081  ORF g.194081 m.194081 type:complete len:410 (+) comp25789_c3_seq11:79-1308(+)
MHNGNVSNLVSFPEDPVEQLTWITQGVCDSDTDVQLTAVTAYRTLLSRPATALIAQVIANGLVKKLVEFLSWDHMTVMQFEAAWALTNVISGPPDEIAEVIAAGAVPLFKKLLDSPVDEVREQAIWAISNIAGHGPPYRDVVLAEGCLDAVLSILNSEVPLSLLTNATWALKNLCMGMDPPPDFSLLLHYLPTLVKLLEVPDEIVLTNTCWVVSCLCKADHSTRQTVLDSNVHLRLAELLQHPTDGVQIPALHAIGNVVSGTHEQTQAILDIDILSRFHQLLQQHNDSVRENACWILSNVAAGTVSQIQALIDHNLIPMLVNVTDKSNFRSRKEAAWALSNITCRGTKEQVFLYFYFFCSLAALVWLGGGYLKGRRQVCWVSVCFALFFFPFCLNKNKGNVAFLGECDC